MHTVITVSLSDHAQPYRMHEDAYDALRRYLDGARVSLTGDPGQAEVVADLEQSIAEKLAGRLASTDRVVSGADIDAVLAAIGPVGDTGKDPAPLTDRPRGRRRLCRIREGQEIAGVCMGLAAYAELRVDWVRTIFVLLTLVSVGLFLIVYIILAFWLPVVDTRKDWVALLDCQEL